MPEESRNILSKFKFTSKFSNLSLNSTPERDGSKENDTLIHNAFVKYYQSRGEPFPAWLGVQAQEVEGNGGSNSGNQFSQYANSKYQPVHRPQPHHSQSAYQPRSTGDPEQQGGGYSQRNSSSETSSGYQPRSSSRLQDMYNKSRQQSIPGAGYSTQPAFNRSNSTVTVGPSRLKEKMMRNNSFNNVPNLAQNSGVQSSYSNGGSNGTRPTWGRQ